MDRLSPDQRSRNMGRIRGKDTAPEILVRRLVCQLGFRSRYRVCNQKLPGRPDLVFPRLKKIVFVNGCFWHSHACKAAHIPRSRLEYWGPKLMGNKLRDKKNLKRLRQGGYKILVLWECQLSKTSFTAARLAKFLHR